MAEELKKEKEEKINVDDIVAQKILEKEAEIRAELEKKYKEDLAKVEEDIVKQMEDTALEASESLKKNDEVVADKVDTTGLDNVEAFANRIKAKREKERIAREVREKEIRYETLEKENKRYKLKEQLDKIKKDEPYLAETIDELISEDSIDSVEQLDIIFNDSLRRKLKTSYAYESAIKRAGGDPRTYSENTGVVNDAMAREERRKQRILEKKAKYRR